MSKPMTQKDMLEELWRKVCGNGEPGLIDRFEQHVKEDEDQQQQIIDAINGLTATVAGLTGRLDGHMDTARPSRREINRQRIAEVTVIAGVLALVAGGVVLLLLRVILPDDIRAIIEAWRAG